MIKQIYLQNEIWQDIKGYEDLYQISNLGRVKSMSRWVTNGDNQYKYIHETIRKIQINKLRYGYCEISLYKCSHAKRFKIHRLVAEAFIDNPNNKLEVNHKDGIKLNNCVDNLEWVTSKENKEHAWSNGLCNANHKKQKIICLETKVIFESAISASRILNIDIRSIFRMLKGEQKAAKGFTFARLKNNINI
jgi:hypothetical protein